MGWLGQLLSRRRRYDELSESIREHLDEKQFQTPSAQPEVTGMGRPARESGDPTRKRDR